MTGNTDSSAEKTLFSHPKGKIYTVGEDGRFTFKSVIGTNKPRKNPLFVFNPELSFNSMPTEKNKKPDDEKQKNADDALREHLLFLKKLTNYENAFTNVTTKFDNEDLAKNPDNSDEEFYNLFINPEYFDHENKPHNQLEQCAQQQTEDRAFNYKEPLDEKQVLESQATGQFDLNKDIININTPISNFLDDLVPPSKNTSNHTQRPILKPKKTPKSNKPNRQSKLTSPESKKASTELKAINNNFTYESINQINDFITQTLETLNFSDPHVLSSINIEFPTILFMLNKIIADKNFQYCKENLVEPKTIYDLWLLMALYTIHELTYIKTCGIDKNSSPIGFENHSNWVRFFHSVFPLNINSFSEVNNELGFFKKSSIYFFIFFTKMVSALHNNYNISNKIYHAQFRRTLRSSLNEKIKDLSLKIFEKFDLTSYGYYSGFFSPKTLTPLWSIYVEINLIKLCFLSVINLLIDNPAKELFEFNIISIVKQKQKNNVTFFKESDSAPEKENDPTPSSSAKRTKLNPEAKNNNPKTLPPAPNNTMVVKFK